MIATQSRRAPPPRRRALAGAAALASAARPASSRAAHASRPGTWRRPLRTPRELAQPARGESAHAQESARGEERERERQRERARASPPAVSPSRRGKRRAHARWAQRAGFLSGGEKGEGLGQDAGTASQQRCLRASSSALPSPQQRHLPSSEASRAQALAPPRSFRHARVDAHELEGSRGQRCRPSGSAEPPYAAAEQIRVRCEHSTSGAPSPSSICHRDLLLTSSAVSHKQTIP